MNQSIIQKVADGASRKKFGLSDSSSSSSVVTGTSPSPPPSTPPLPPPPAATGGGGGGNSESGGGDDNDNDEHPEDWKPIPPPSNLGSQPPEEVDGLGQPPAATPSTVHSAMASSYPLRTDLLGPNGLAVALEDLLGKAGLLGDKVLVRKFVS